MTRIWPKRFACLGSSSPEQAKARAEPCTLLALLDLGEVLLHETRGWNCKRANEPCGRRDPAVALGYRVLTTRHSIF